MNVLRDVCHSSENQNAYEPSDNYLNLYYLNLYREYRVDVECLSEVHVPYFGFRVIFWL